MVKNKIGGNKAKKFARKNVGGNNSNRKIRYATNEDEVYCIVTKIIGNGQLIALGNDGVERLCFIRNKFSGRNKQSNLVRIGSWIIAGIRSWESTKEGKLSKCDLLEIYTESEKHSLLQESQTNFDKLLKEELRMTNVNEEDELNNSISFSYDNEDKSTEDENKVVNKSSSKNTNASVGNIIDGIDLDEI